MAFKNSTVGEISKLVNGEIIGDEKLTLSEVASLELACSSSLSFLTNKKYLNLLESTQAGAVITSKEITDAPTTLIRVDNPDLAFSLAVKHMSPEPADLPEVVDERAFISPDAVLHSDVSVGPGAIIESGADIGVGCKIWPGSYVGFDVKIGENCILYPNSTVMHGCKLGDGVILQPGSVVGSDGFGYVWDGEKHVKILQLGNVILENDVEIGANTVIDRARFGSTVIEKGAKLDNLIQIAHNCRIGEFCAFAAQVGIAGSAHIGSGTFMGGRSGAHGHIHISQQTKVAANSVVTKDINTPGQLLSGDPAKPHKQRVDELRNIKKISSMKEAIKELERRIDNLEEKTKNNQ
ncbi:MAG: UDP-3-O-(3-hydroxymyristoyl)glucosamine N-acyltransferase [Planctomycetota bacterium]|jgi:UDP-3-O-[3-hydroxymyristoyl] glucosamine N-acyltransferase